MLLQCIIQISDQLNMLLHVLATMMTLAALTVGPMDVNLAVTPAAEVRSAQLLRGLRHCRRLKKARPKFFGTVAGMVRLTPELPYRALCCFTAQGGVVFKVYGRNLTKRVSESSNSLGLCEFRLLQAMPPKDDVV